MYICIFIPIDTNKHKGEKNVMMDIGKNVRTNYKDLDPGGYK